jgi:hypothetical protein
LAAVILFEFEFSMALLRKTTFNFLLEGISLAVLMSLVTTGLAMKFAMPPGSGDRLMQWGLSRHEWGAVHFGFASTLIGLLLLHIILHWRWIWTMARGQDPKTRRMRGIAFLFVTILFLAFLLLPWLVPVHPEARGGRHHGNRWNEGRSIRD